MKKSCVWMVKIDTGADSCGIFTSENEAKTVIEKFVKEQLSLKDQYLMKVKGELFWEDNFNGGLLIYRGIECNGADMYILKMDLNHMNFA